MSARKLAKPAVKINKNLIASGNQRGQGALILSRQRISEKVRHGFSVRNA